ncbi:MAG TPA: DUF429 domain-containing protein, partial [Gaiellaceae bacterium]|nr:DUF429 domain-containing protein [Gaiellaceae bacterium]
SLSSLLRESDELRDGAAAVVAVDAPLGLPASFVHAAGAPGFAEWLEDAPADAFEPVVDPAEWSPRRPFFRLPSRKTPGSRKAFEAAAARHAVDLRREIDRATNANPVFALNIPGQVAPAAIALWRELREARAAGIEFEIWPFETARLDGGLVLAEIYPRAAYGTALSPSLPARPRSLAKTKEDVRRSALAALRDADWVRDRHVRIRHADAAERSEDDFDALLTAAALLRLLLEGRPLYTTDPDPVAEGGILCA